MEGQAVRMAIPKCQGPLELSNFLCGRVRRLNLGRLITGIKYRQTKKPMHEYCTGSDRCRQILRLLKNYRE